jgi:hypothetical protein
MTTGLTIEALVTLDLLRRHMFALRDDDEELQERLFRMIGDMHAIYPHAK